MIRFHQGQDILQTTAEALVNPVNCVGVMGAGLALQVKRAFPGNFTAYAEACARGDVRLGRVFLHDRGPDQPGPRYIVNFPTKAHWQDQSRCPAIRAGLADLVNVVAQKGITSIAVPKLGCGLGGLRWEEVQPLVIEAFSSTQGLSAVLVHAYL
jgi:O-acetyl-ADP-ribose deacetylase (regulator of RNase III)